MYHFNLFDKNFSYKTSILIYIWNCDWWLMKLIFFFEKIKNGSFESVFRIDRLILWSIIVTVFNKLIFYIFQNNEILALN